MIDLKQYRGRLQVDASGRLWHGRSPIAPTLRAVSFEADRAAQVLTDPDVVVVPIMAVHGAQVPWGKVVVDWVPVVTARSVGFAPRMYRGTVESIRAAVDLIGQERCVVCAPASCVPTVPRIVWGPLVEPASHYPGRCCGGPGIAPSA